MRSERTNKQANERMSKRMSNTKDISKRREHKKNQKIISEMLSSKAMAKSKSTYTISMCSFVAFSYTEWSTYWDFVFSFLLLGLSILKSRYFNMNSTTTTATTITTISCSSRNSKSIILITIGNYRIQTNTHPCVRQSVTNLHTKFILYMLCFICFFAWHFVSCMLLLLRTHLFEVRSFSHTIYCTRYFISTFKVVYVQKQK